MKKLTIIILLLVLTILIAACRNYTDATQSPGNTKIETIADITASTGPKSSPQNETIAENPEPVDNDSLNDSLIGLWHSMNMVAAGFGERYAFNEDGTFIYGTSQMDESNHQLYAAGTWSIVNGELKLEIETRLVMPEGDINEIVPGDDLIILDRGVVKMIYNPPEVETCSISITGADPETGRNTIAIDGVTFYDFKNQTDMFDYYYDLTDPAFCPADSDF